jgi:hypothetical protein
MNASRLIRGGIAELYTSPTPSGAGNPVQAFRPNGNFKCYFMMNPENISVSTQIETNNAAPTPPQLNSAGFATSIYLMDGQTVTFTIVFNRMYEVWKGDVHWGGPLTTPNTGGTTLPGPSDLGCAWDIRALERLCGLLDAVNYQKGTTGQGAAGGFPGIAASLPVQVVFGGANSVRFTGRIASLDYSYDLFSKDMIPLQATANIGIVKVMNATDTSQDLITSLIQDITAQGVPVVPNQTGGFNSQGPYGRPNYADGDPRYQGILQPNGTIGGLNPGGTLDVSPPLLPNFDLRAALDPTGSQSLAASWIPPGGGGGTTHLL